MSGENLKDVLKAIMDTPAANIQAVVKVLEAAAPKDVEIEQPGNSLIVVNHYHWSRTFQMKVTRILFRNTKNHKHL